MEARLERIKQRLFEEYYQKKTWWGDDLSIFDDDPGLAAKPLVVRKALAVQKVCREMPIAVKDDELVVGICSMSSVGFGHTFPRYETDAEAEAAAKVCLNRKSVWGHHNPYYQKILEKGIGAIIQEARELKEKVPAADTTRDWYDAVVLSLQGAEILATRYAKLCDYLAGEATTAERAAELREIARICRKVPLQPAGSFQEALQSVWLVHAILQSTLDYTSIGRVDQYLWPYYQQDLARGALTRSQAREMLGSFLVKFNERVQLDNSHIEDHFTFGDWSQGGDPNLETTHLKMANDMPYTYGQSQNHWLQNCIVGGLTPDGRDGTNDLTHMVIELINELELIDPLVSLRLHKDSPQAIVDTAAKWLAKGGAQPTIFNDDVVIPGMVKHLGIPVEDARDYSNDGCWETLPYGRTEFSYGHIEVLLSLESTLNRGRSLLNGNHIGPDSGELSRFKSFEELFAAFKEQVRQRIDSAIENKLRYYDEVHKIAPDPFLSGLTGGLPEEGQGPHPARRPLPAVRAPGHRFFPLRRLPGGHQEGRLRGKDGQPGQAGGGAARRLAGRGAPAAVLPEQGAQIRQRRRLRGLHRRGAAGVLLRLLRPVEQEGRLDHLRHRGRHLRELPALRLHLRRLGGRPPGPGPDRFQLLGLLRPGQERAHRGNQERHEVRPPAPERRLPDRPADELRR